MAMNKVQFQRGLSMVEFFDLYGTQEKCEEVVREWRWPRGFVCPSCGQCEHSEFRRRTLLYFQCCACRHQCSLISGTVFASTKLALPRWFLAMHLMTQAKNNVAALELRRHLGVSYPTAWAIKHKLMELMRLREEPRQLTGRVEIDDAYLGGECPGGKPGRGSPNKVPFVAAVQTTESGAPFLVCLSKRPFTKESILQFAEQSLAAPATLVSDGLGCLCGRQGPRHHSRATRHRWRRRVGQAARVRSRQHHPGQPQDRVLGNLPRVRLCQVRASLSRPSAVLLQPALRLARDPRAACSRWLYHESMLNTGVTFS